MARAKAHSDATAGADYEEDFFAWTQEQAQALRARATLGLDWDNLAEEVDSMGRRDRRKLESRLRRILHHLLKWQAQPELRGPSWRDTLYEQRRQAEKLLRDSPSLRPHLPALRDEAYPDAVRDAVRDSGLRPRTFPAECPFAIEQVLDQHYLPEDEDTEGRRRARAREAGDTAAQVPTTSVIFDPESDASGVDSPESPQVGRRLLAGRAASAARFGRGRASSGLVCR